MPAPIITFRAGQCEIVDPSAQPAKVKPLAQPGYLYLYLEDDLIHFCWRKRDKSPDEPELDLVMVPEDGYFHPYEWGQSKPSSAKTNGRIFVLKFSSSSQRYLFWLQSKAQCPGAEDDPTYMSSRDLMIGDIVNRLLQGEEVDVASDIATAKSADEDTRDRRRDRDRDDTMEDAEGSRSSGAHHGSGSGGAGPGATGGDIREEGQESREGGADGARAASSSTTDAAAAVKNLLDSLKGQQNLTGGRRQQQPDVPYPYLNHLLQSTATAPLIKDAPVEFLDRLLAYLPPAILVLAAGPASGQENHQNPSAAAVETATASLSLESKRSLINRVLQSVQFNQGLVSLTKAIRDGGLPSVAEAMGINAENGGYMQGGQMPLGGGRAVKAFIEGIKKKVVEKK